MRTLTPGDLHRLRSAVVAVLALTVALSLTANVLSAESSLIGRAVAAWPPVALLICTDLISRVPTTRRALGIGRQAAAVLIAGIAAALSYGHMVTLALDHGASERAAHVVPLTVDGLAVVASLCLLEISARLRAATQPTVHPATAAPAAPPAGAGVRDQGKKPTGPAGTAKTTDAADDSATTALGARVRALAVEHPDWTQTAIAAHAGCSVRTVRRHLSTPTTPTQDTDVCEVAA